MTSSTRLLLVLASAAAACGGEDDDCQVQLLEPCPDCGSGEVLRAAEGEAAIGPRPAGGHVAASCGGQLLWHDGALAIEATASVALEDGAEIDAVAAGADDVVFAVLGSDGDDQLAAVARDGSERWRATLGNTAGGAELRASGDSVYYFGFAQGPDLLGEEVASPAMATARVDAATGALVWLWLPPAGAQPAGFFPREDGGAVVTGSFIGTIDLGAAGVLSAGDAEAAAFIAELGPDGAPVQARAIAATTDATVTAAAPVAGGGLAIAGTYDGDADLGGGVVLGPGGGWFAALLAADGNAEWAYQLGAGLQVPRRVVLIGDQVIVGGNDDDLLGFVVALAGGDVAWRVDAEGADSQRLESMFATTADSVLALLSVRAGTDSGEAELHFGRIDLQGETTVAVQLAP